MARPVLREAKEGGARGVMLVERLGQTKKIHASP